MQFFYKRTTNEKDYIDSLNTDCVTRTYEDENGGRMIFLNDGHMESRYDQYPVIKGGHVTGSELRKEAAYYQSEIQLSPEDNQRWLQYMDYKMDNITLKGE